MVKILASEIFQRKTLTSDIFVMSDLSELQLDCSNPQCPPTGVEGTEGMAETTHPNVRTMVMQISSNRIKVEAALLHMTTIRSFGFGLTETLKASLQRLGRHQLKLTQTSF